MLSCTAAGAGSGALKSTRAQFIEECRSRAADFERAGKIDAETMGLGPTRVQLQNKDPIGWRRSVAHWPSIRPTPPPRRCAPCSRAGRPSTTWKPS